MLLLADNLGAWGDMAIADWRARERAAPRTREPRGERNIRRERLKMFPNRFGFSPSLESWMGSVPGISLPPLWGEAERERLTEEVTNGNPWAPDTRVMGLISKAAFEVGDYWRIVDILHKRLETFDRKNWRQSYQALVLLEYLLTHGPESIFGEFQCDKEVISECGDFQYNDEKGFNWGLAVKSKCERILEFLDDGDLLKEERQRARKLTCGIKGYGSFSQRSSSSKARRFGESIYNSFERCNSQCNSYAEQEDSDSLTAEGFAGSEFYMDSETSVTAIEKHEFIMMPLNEQIEGSDLKKENTENENMYLEKQKSGLTKNLTAKGNDDQWIPGLETKPLLGVDENQRCGYADSPLEPCNSHPFIHIKPHAEEGLLSSGLR